MPIQWYPGHMTKARRLIAESMPSQDVIIEVLDARMPRSSENPVVTELRRHKPVIKVLSKSDLADPETTKAWIHFFENEKHPSPGDGLRPGKVVAIALTTTRPGEAKTKLPALCKALALHPRGPGKTPRVMIVGIPNVGKSTLINTLMDRKVAKVGDEPAVTKGQQIVTLKSGMTISDNPGIMWPKIEDEDASLRLAFGGAIPDSAIDYETVGFWGAGYLLAHYPDLLMARYKLKALPAKPEALLEEIGKRRGGLRAGGVVDMHKAADALIHDFRQGAIGRISLEWPPEPEPESSPEPLEPEIETT
jgi:ribosome biogenesis GTPase A